MTTTNEAADPIAKGIIPVAKQSFLDLFKWRQRVVITNDFGEEHTEWQSPEPLKNPISLMAQLSARDVRLSSLPHLYLSRLRVCQLEFLPGGTYATHRDLSECFICIEERLTDFSGYSSSVDSWHGQLMHLTFMLCLSRPSNLLSTTRNPTPTSPLLSL
jgi:hypothetical protein